MPRVRIETPADRSDGVLENMHPWLNEDGTADVILLPNDTTRGRGSFKNIDALGNPEGFQLGQPPKIVSRNLYMGTHPDRVTKQNSVPISMHETSFLVNGPLVEGDPPPDLLTVGAVPKPLPLTMQKVPVEVAGFPASTPSSPYWMSYSYNRNGRRSALSPAIKLPPVATGQSIRVTLPDKIPLGATHIDLWLSQPGTGTSSASGQMRYQRGYRFSVYGGHEVELTGPFLYSTEAPTGTSLSTPADPAIRLLNQRAPLKMGSYHFRITAANQLGESLPSGAVGPFTVAGSDYYKDDQGNFKAGYGKLVIRRRELPQGASGWYAYVLLGAQWHRVFDPVTGLGLTKPFPPSYSEVVTQGWTGSEEFSGSFLLNSHDLPVENTSGVSDPDSPLDVPSIFGASRPAPGRYYARETEVDENGEESQLSDAAALDIAQTDVMRVVFSNSINHLPNATFVEKGADGLPLGYVVTGNVPLDNGKLTMEPGSEVFTDVVRVDPTRPWNAGATIEVLLPETGTLSGTFQVVLREVNASAVQTDTTLASLTTVDEHRYYETIAPAGYGAFEWQPDTQSVQIIYKCPGNMRAVISRQLFNDLSYGFRRREDILPASPNSSPETTANPSGSVAVEPSPTAVGVPDRPSSSGEVIETIDFSTMPASPGWTQDVTGSTLAVSGGKLIAEKTSLGTARANLQKTFAPPASLEKANALGITLNGITVPDLPDNGAITLANLRRPSGERFAWVDVDNRHESAQLSILSPAESSGNITTTLDEGGATPRATSVVAVKESASLTINAPVAQDGSVAVILDDSSTQIAVTKGSAGQREVVEVEITRGAPRTEYLAINLLDPSQDPRFQPYSSVSARVLAGDSPETIANKLRSFPQHEPGWNLQPWVISGTGRKVVFTTKAATTTPGGHYFVSLQSGVTATITTQLGVDPISQDTAISVADKIRGAEFEGYEVSGTGETVNFTALEPGAKGNASYDPGSTGAGGSMVVLSAGARDTVEEIATKIEATYSGNSYFDVTSSGAIVTLQATSSGAKLDAVFSAGTTGTLAKMDTTVQGSTDIVAYAQDRLGVQRKRTLLDGISASSASNVGLSVSGAGYSPSGGSSAVLSLWSSSGSSPKILSGLFEDVDLGGYPAGTVSIGVSSETSNATWRVEIEEAKITDRGETYYRYHDYIGELLNQVHGFFNPNQPQRDDLYLQDYSQAVLPGETYTASIFARWSGVPSNAMPFYMYCITPYGEERPIGDLITQTSQDFILPTESGWIETTPFTFTTPEDCYELRLESRRIGPGEIVAQELCISLGDTVKRTPLYALSGTYTGTLDISTPSMPRFLSLGRERRTLDIDVDAPLGTGAVITWRSADSREGPYGLSHPDPLEVEEKNFLRVDVSATSNGLLTPEIKAPFPMAEYVLLHGLRPLNTFLKSDRTEFEGGAVFSKLEEPSEPPEVVYQRLPGGRYQRTATYPPVGQLPAFELQVFTPEARRYIEDRSGMVDFCIEAWGKILTIRTSSPIRFERQIRDIHVGTTYMNHYVAKVSDAWVLSVEDMPSPLVSV